MYLHDSHTLDAQFACFIEKLPSCPLTMLSMQGRKKKKKRKYENA